MAQLELRVENGLSPVECSKSDDSRIERVISISTNSFVPFVFSFPRLMASFTENSESCAEATRYKIPRHEKEPFWFQLCYKPMHEQSLELIGAAHQVDVLPDANLSRCLDAILCMLSTSSRFKDLSSFELTPFASAQNLQTNDPMDPGILIKNTNAHASAGAIWISIPRPHVLVAAPQTTERIECPSWADVKRRVCTDVESVDTNTNGADYKEEQDQVANPIQRLGIFMASLEPANQRPRIPVFVTSTVYRCIGKRLYLTTCHALREFNFDAKLRSLFS
jgi:hypothetical protein